MTDCGCRVSTHKNTPNGLVECEPHIAHCPLHGAAEELLNLLKRAKEIVPNHPGRNEIEGRKTFRNNHGRGFHITFPNGVMLSTQFGWGSYCENYGNTLNIDEEMKKTDWESNDAEIAIIGPTGKWLTKDFKDNGDDVLGHIKINEWLEAFDWCRKWSPTKRNTKTQAEGK